MAVSSSSRVGQTAWISVPLTRVIPGAWAAMSAMAVLSAARAIRRGAHIRMTDLDRYLPKGLVKFLDILADICVLILALIMIVVGWSYASGIGAKGFYVSMPWLSRFWLYFPVPLAGVAMLIFEIEALYNHIKSICVKEAK